MARPCFFSAWFPGLVASLVFCASGASSAGINPIHSFNNLPRGAHPSANLILDSAGNLYGTTSDGGTYNAGTVFELSPTMHGQWNQKILYSFTGLADGCSPSSGLVFDAAGNLHGTTLYGGINSYDNRCYNGGGGGGGVAFKLSPDGKGGWTESVLYSFGYSSPDGAYPTAGVIFDRAGNLYGATTEGGSGGAGTVYELSPSATGQWTETILYSFTGQSDGGSPSGVVFDQAGNLFGGAGYGGDLNCGGGYFPKTEEQGCGVVFELSNNGSGAWTETVVHVFGLFDGASPDGSLTFDSSGNLFGATTYGPGDNCQYQGCGTIFRMANDGSWSLTSIYTFAGGIDGTYPNGGLVFDQNGNLYGTTLYGGGDSASCILAGCGTAFELQPRSGGVWQEKILRSFGIGTGLNALSYPQGGVTFDQSGNLYGTLGSSLDYAVGAVYKLTPAATGVSTLSSVYTFYPSGDGALGTYPPAGGVVADSAGNLYGTTQGGGRWSNGSVYEVSPHPDGTWSERVLYSFTGQADGGGPQQSLVIDSAGNLYGTASGGPTACSCGVVFELSKASGSWQESVIYSFAGATDGENPGGIIFDNKGNLYGAAATGGPLTACYGGGCGTIFELSPSAGGWQENTLYFFQGGVDGAFPRSVTFDQAGNLFGVTSGGGVSTNSNCFDGGCGTVFQLTPTSTGWTKTTVYTFAGHKDGSDPFGVAVDSAGNVYGITSYGGVEGKFCGGGCGTVFELSPSADGLWNKATLYSFQPEQVPGDGAHPAASVILDAAGNLYGTTYGLNNYGSQGGTVFKLSPGSGGAWSETILGSFSGTDGSLPAAPLMLDSSGNLFGTASGGGTSLLGVVFEIPASEINAPQNHATARTPLTSNRLRPRRSPALTNRMANPTTAGHLQ